MGHHRAHVSQGHERGGGQTHEEHSGSHGHGGHDGHRGHDGHAEVFRRLFWVSLVLAVPVVALSPMFADLLGYTVPRFPGASWVPPVLGSVVYAYGGRPFLTGAVQEARARKPGMMLLVALAITVAFAASWATTLGLTATLDFWWELALLVVIMLLGHWLEMRALGAASGALDALAALLPDTAERLTDEGSEQVPLDALRADDVVLVRAGGRVPADGVVVDGSAHVDESMISGESRPLRRAAGDRVVGGTVATDSTLRVRVTAVGSDTALAGIQKLVADAQASGSRAQALADRAAAFLFWFALVAGVLTFGVWAALGDMPDAVERTVTVLVIACPHALGLAIPLVIAISTERAARAGVLVKSRLALERMRTVDTVLFDKTGTLTSGRLTLVGRAAVAGLDDDELLALAAAVEADSEHPVARAVVAAHAGDTPAATDFRSLPGRGVRAVVGGREVHVGGPALLAELGLEVPSELGEAVTHGQQNAASVLHVVRDGAVVGVLAVADAVRPESRAAVDALHAHGVRVAMVTGDAQHVAQAVAHELGIDEVFAEVLPADKDAKVVELRERGRRVAMAGDGVNDAPALTRADVGIAIGAGTDVAIESAGVVLASDDPRGVVSVIVLSKASYRKMWQNLVWAAGYNLIAVPLAAGVLAWAGFVLSPAVGAVMMSASTVVVALNAQLLRRVDLDPGTVTGRAADSPSR
ncbi:copper-translocating P-type ATPase [Cellulomonas sp. APG4]|uniref:copper-translocating P-type ATPase n=1 Tax=Cellulomonas sp. APG4 TaxID=1538656 RepID=UPI00137B207D|nr:copper-translocating P-type ATPase [Cellulomonas sp. APG4]NCT89453.1 copper-translocating P-type ATPase [Cellulomonas sp. APG4]